MIDNVVNIDGIYLEKELADNNFFVKNAIENRFLNPAYISFHLFIQNDFIIQYQELQGHYNKAINILDDEDQIITNTLVILYKEKLNKEFNFFDFN